MTKLIRIQLDDDTTVYVESTETETASPDTPSDTGVTYRGGGEAKGIGLKVPKFDAIESTIRTYTHHTLNAFKQVAIANVDKVTLEFGVQVSGEAGIPYITKGNAESNLKITVECSFDQNGNPRDSGQTDTSED